MSKKLTTELFIERAVTKHGDKYDYCNTKYGKNGREKVEIICKEHGKFLQSPEMHLKGQGCPSCGKNKSVKSRTHTTDVFIEKANIIHNNFYDYSDSNYINSITKIKIICPKHGLFEQKAGCHLQGEGCYKCGVESHITTIEDFKTKAIEVHSHKYIYDNSYFVETPTGNKVNVTCPEHGDFIIWKNSFLKGYGCKKCSQDYAGFSKTGWINFCKNKGFEKAYCYIIRLFNEIESFIKIGISTNFKVRMNHIPYNHEVIYLIEDVPEVVFTKEKSLHKTYKHHKYKPLISFDGEYECFSLNIYN